MSSTGGVTYPFKYRELSSLVTLFTMTSVAVYTFCDFYRRGYPLWTFSTSFFTIIGGGGGLLWELFGNPNWRAAETVECFRRANVGLVMGSSVATTLLSSLGYWEDSFTVFVALLTSFLYWESLTNIPYPAYKGLPQGGAGRTFAVLLLHHLFEIIVMVYFGLTLNTLKEPKTVYRYLIASNVLNFLSFTPPSIGKSAIFHGINTIVSLLTYLGLSNLDYIPSTPSIRWEFALGGAIAGYLFVITNPVLRNQIRFWISNQFWQKIYGGLMATTMPPPKAPTFEHGEQIQVVPYDQTHPLSKPLNILSAESIPLNQHFPGIYESVLRVFNVITFLDRIFPQGNVNAAPSDKPRIDLHRPVEFYVPQVILQYGTETRFNAPTTLIKWDSARQAAAWMTLFGHCSTLLRRLNAQEKSKFPDCTHVIDLNWMRGYRSKPDFYGYGGRAYFQFSTETENKLTLKYVTQFDDVTDSVALSVDEPTSTTLETSIRSLLSSSGIINVAGFHLAGIHMFFNLVSLSLYNVFDVVPKGQAKPSFTHPFRAAMNIHFYNHVLVEEKTTAHLMDKGGVFNQIFALDHPSICNFVRDFFNRVEYGQDADIEARAEILAGGLENVPRHSQIHWQNDYKVIFTAYATELVDLIWNTDQDLENDLQMRQYYSALNGLYTKRGNNNTPLPTRYQELKKKAGLVRYIADTIFVVTVLHEVFGTRVPAYATNSNLLPSQIAKDGRPSTVEDYTSLILVTAATSRVKFTRLLDQNPNDPFETTDIPYRTRLSGIFFGLQQRLRVLESHWTRTAEEVYINEQYHRVLPSDLEVAAGY